MHPFQNNENNRNFSDPLVRHAYVEDTQNCKALWQKELDVNKGEQQLLSKRISLMKSFVNDLPSSDPQYHMLCSQIKMDQVELDELQFRENLLIQKISN